LTAEKPVTKFVRGKQSRVWVKKRARNEALDCRIYALGALYILNPNLKVIAERMMEKTEDVKEEKEETPREPLPGRRSTVPRRKPGGFIRNW